MLSKQCTSLLQGLQPPEVKIKWPNDLYANGLKVGGVLCTSTYSSKKFNIVVGEHGSFSFWNLGFGVPQPGRMCGSVRL